MTGVVTLLTSVAQLTPELDVNNTSGKITELTDCVLCTYMQRHNNDAIFVKISVRLFTIIYLCKTYISHLSFLEN